MPKKLFTLLVLLMVLLPARGQENASDMMLMEAVQTGDYFLLDSLKRTRADSISFWMRDFSTALLDNAFNRKQQAVESLQKVISTYGSKLSLESRVYLSSLLADNLQRLDHQKEASLMLLGLLNQFDREGYNISYQTDVLNMERKFRLLSDVSLYGFDSSARDVTLPMELASRNVEGLMVQTLSIPVSVGRSTARAALSTSESANLVTESMARALGMQPVGETADGKKRTLQAGTVVLARELRLGTLTISNVPFEVMEDGPDDALSRAYLSSFNLILSLPLLEHLGSMRIDFSDSTVTFLLSGKPQAAAPNMMLDPLTGALVLRMGLPMGKDLLLQTDTSSAFSALVHESLPAALRPAEPSPATLYISSVMGLSPYRGYFLRDFSFVLNGQHMSVSGIKVCQEKTEEQLRDGILGLDFLSGFSRCVLDMDAMHLWLNP